MRKSVFALVVVAILALAVPASAQRIGYIPQTWDGVQYRIMGNQVQMLTADNLGLVNGLTDQLRRAGYRSLARDIRWDDRYGAYGIPIGQGFYPMYDRDRRPMSKKKAAIIYGAIGAVGGELVGRYVGPGTRRNQITSTIVGAGFGALVGALTHRNNGRRDDGMIVTPQGQQGRYVGRGGIPVAVGTKRPSVQGSGYGYQELEWQMLRNEFNGVTVYARVQGSDPDQPIVISAGQTVKVQIPRGSQIWVEAQVCVDKGCTVQRWRQDVGRRPLPQGAGWVFYNPEEGR